MIAPVSEFVWNGILTPFNNLYILTWGLLEPIVSALPPDHPNFVYANLSVLVWFLKFLTSIVAVTAMNSSAFAEFNSFIVTVSENYENFTGTLSGESGMTYIAKHTYLELTNESKRENSTEIAVNLARALNATVHYVMKTFEFM
ncbi:MAG: hypothetical protein ABWW66_07740 [Archaeoglobaceae archaeon]